MFTELWQIPAHMLGDYIFQHHWMAENKTKRWFPAICHALTYSIFFLPICSGFLAWFLVFFVHLVIDRFCLIRYIRNFDRMGDDKAFMLYIAADNTLHLVTNYFILKL